VGKLPFDVTLPAARPLDMKMIYEYIAGTLMEPIIAERQYIRIETAVYSLEEIQKKNWTIWHNKKIKSTVYA